MVDVAPPVPAGLRISWQVRTRLRLRIENNQMVRIRPGIVAGVIHEPSVDVTDVLFASVECDVNAASTTLLAILRHEHVASVAQTQRIRLVRLGIECLIKALHRACNLTTIWRIQTTINMLQYDSGLIVPALIDIRIFVAVVESACDQLHRHDERVTGAERSLKDK